MHLSRPLFKMSNLPVQNLGKNDQSALDLVPGEEGNPQQEPVWLQKAQIHNRPLGQPGEVCTWCLCPQTPSSWSLFWPWKGIRDNLAVSCVIYTGLDWEEGFPSLFPSTSRTASSKYVLVWPYQTNLAQRKVSPLEEYWQSPALVSRSMTYPAIFHRISSEPYFLTTWPSASVEALFMPLKDISNMQWTLSKGGHYKMASNLLRTSARHCTLQHQDASLNDSPTLWSAM